MLKSHLKSVVIKFQSNPLQTVSARFVLLFVSFLLLTLLSCDNIINHISTNGCEETDSIGVWKFLGLANETVTAIAIHPQKPNIIYTGTAKDFSAGIPGRLYKSTDCGKSWNVIMEGADYSFTQILFDPHNSNTIYALPQMLLKSTDGGTTWADISSGITINWETRVAEIAIDPVDNNTVYAGITDAGVVLKSKDAGYTWVVTGLGETGQLIQKLTIDSNLPQTIYAGINFYGL